MENIDDLIIDALMSTRMDLSLSGITNHVNSKGANASTSDVQEHLESLAKAGTISEELAQEIISN